MNLERSDKKYIEIEEFSDFELTQCIAYEMAIRDSNLEEITKDHSGYFLEGEDFNNLYEFVTGFHHMQEVRMRNGYAIVTGMKVTYNSEKYDPNGDPVEGEKVLCNDKIEEFKNVFKKYQEISNGIAEEGYFSEKWNPLLNEHLSKYDGHEIYNQVIENFKRPKMRTDQLKTLDSELVINLNRPLNEIIKYITHVKEDIDNNNLLKSPIELFGEELDRTDSLICNENGKCFDSRTLLSRQQRMADMFFIYDGLKVGYTQSKIRNLVYNYYADKGVENITLDPSTLRKYRDIATAYIDDERYKEMITGIKQANF